MNLVGHVRPARSARVVCHVATCAGDFCEVYAWAREAVGESAGKLTRVGIFPRGTRTATGTPPESDRF
jgi:hypothetical protein